MRSYMERYEDEVCMRKIDEISLGMYEADRREEARKQHNFEEFAVEVERLVAIKKFASNV